MVASACRLRNACNCFFFPWLRREGLNTVIFQLHATKWINFWAHSTRPTSITRSKICLRLFSICCSTDLRLLSKTKKSDDGHARESKDEIHRLLWAIIQNKRKAPNCDKPWLQAPYNTPLSSYSFFVFAFQVLSPMFFSPTVSVLALKISSNTRHPQVNQNWCPFRFVSVPYLG